MLDINNLIERRDKILNDFKSQTNVIDNENKLRSELKNLNIYITILEGCSKESLEKQLILVEREYNILNNRRSLWLMSNISKSKHKTIEAQNKEFDKLFDVDQKKNHIKILKTILKE